MDSSFWVSDVGRFVLPPLFVSVTAVFGILLIGVLYQYILGRDGYMSLFSGVLWPAFVGYFVLGIIVFSPIHMMLVHFLNGNGFWSHLVVGIVLSILFLIFAIVLREASNAWISRMSIGLFPFVLASVPMLLVYFWYDYSFVSDNPQWWFYSLPIQLALFGGIYGLFIMFLSVQ